MMDRLATHLATTALALLLITGPAQARQAGAPVAESATVPAPAAAPTAPPVTVAAPRPAPVQPFTGAAAGSLLQTIFALCVVLGLLAVLAWAMKRFGPRATGNSAHVRLVGGLNLGGRERIIVVEVGQQWIVVGVSPGRVNALATMPRQGDGAASLPATLADPAATPPASHFGDWLKQTIANREKK